MPGSLAAKVRAKYPGAYDDLDDATLEQKVLAKYPEYADLVEPPLSSPTFRSQNEMDVSGNAIVRGGRAYEAERDVKSTGAGRFLSAVGESVNPITMVQSLGNAALHPIEAVKGMGAAQGAIFDKAKSAYDGGDYVTAARHFVNYLLPVIGPALDQSGDEMQRGDRATGAGHAVGLGLSLFAPQALGNAAKGRAATPRPQARAVEPVNQVQADAVRFGRAQGIPIDYATATGSPIVRRMQTAAGNVPGGAGVAEDALRTQQAAITRTGARLADQVHPAPMSPEAAGSSLRRAVQGTRDMFSSQADDAYATLRAFEADEANAAAVRVQTPKVELRQMRERMQSSLGSLATDAELAEIRRMSAELDAMPYVKRTWNDVRGDVGKRGNAGGGDYEIVKGAAGAPVYDDILQHAPGTSKMTRGEVRASLESALETGHFTNAAKGALDVARKRIEGSPDVSKPTLPPDAGIKAFETMLMPVDLREFKRAMQPTYTELMRAKDITPPMGDKARALVALDRVMNGPDYAPVSVADSALSDLKAMARPSKDGAARTTGQGVAAGAVSRLDHAVRQAVTKAGPKALEALETGRAATKAKWAADDVWQHISDEPVKAFNSAVLRKDSGIAHLDKLAEFAPSEMPKIGRAWLDDMAEMMTREGTVQKAQTIKSAWDNLGPRTRVTLFGPQLMGELDQYFRLAAKMSENPNPSGTAYQLNATKLALMVPAYVVAKLMYTPQGVRVLSKMTQVRPSAAAPAQITRLLAEAERAGVLTRAATEQAAILPRAAQAPGEPRQ